MMMKKFAALILALQENSAAGLKTQTTYIPSK